MSLLRSIPFWFFTIALILSFFAGRMAPEVWVVERTALDQQALEEILEENEGRLIIAVEDSVLWPMRDKRLTEEMPQVEELIVRTDSEGRERHELLGVQSHRGIWSLFPAFVTIVLCFLTREPVTALIGGILAGAMLLGSYNITGDVLLPGLATSSAALIIVLYLMFLGGLLGIWSRNGGAQAFAQWVTTHFVRGPRTAKLTAWLLGVFFFQGGTISTLLVGTTVKPVADKEKVSHEELSYVVDSTASPIAILLPFNAWPFYVQGLIFIGGVSALATETARVSFFFGAIPLYFYAILAVLFTFLLSIDKLPFMSKKFRDAVRRSRETGQLDRPGAKPMQSRQDQQLDVPENYKPAAWEFVVPLTLIIGIAVGTFIVLGSPNVLWAFGIALGVAFFCSRLRGMSLRDLVDGFSNGLQSVVYGAVVLLLAVIIGMLSRETGGGLFLIESLGERMIPWILPALLFLMTLLIAFATGTSWGTFAVSLPLALPLAWALGQHHELTHQLFYLKICFAAVINGSVFGDQCSPISDTSVLSSLATGCDLMDHIRTQIFPCMIAGLVAVGGWTILAFFIQ